MTEEFVIETLDGHHESATRTAAELLAGSVPAACLGLVAYHAAGYHTFLAAALAPASTLRTVILRVIRLMSGEVAAVADWRLLGSTLFLNGISVREAVRGAGLGTRLLHDGVRMARELGMSGLGLDVALDNAPARALYRRMGFEDVDYVRWDELPLELHDGPRPHVRILDWPAFLAHRRAFGFGDISVRPSGGAVSKVRIVGATMRVASGAESSMIAHALYDVVRPSRVFTASPYQPPEASQGFAHFARMRLTLARLGPGVPTQPPLTGRRVGL